MRFFTSPFSVIQTSFWPVLVSLSLFNLLTSVTLWFNIKVNLLYLLVNMLAVLLISFLWWKDLSRESLLGFHSHPVEFSFRIAILLFIASEVLFFLSFFWAFYDASLVPTSELGLSWPPKGVVPLSTFSVPFLNTVILLTRGVTVTWAHHSILNNRVFDSRARLLFTVSLGAYFMFIQYVEYFEAQFSMCDRVYGRTFFITTGFHGLHVTIGALFLFYTFILLSKSYLTSKHHFRFEAAAWYWHFVDVVWLFLFISIYYWGGLTF